MGTLIVIALAVLVIVWCIVKKKNDSKSSETTYTNVYMGADGNVFSRTTSIAPDEEIVFTFEGDNKSTIHTTQRGIENHVKNLFYISGIGGKPVMEQMEYICGLNAKWFKLDNEIFQYCVGNSSECNHFFVEDYNTKCIFLMQYAMVAAIKGSIPGEAKAEIRQLGKDWDIDAETLNEILSSQV